MTHEEVFVLTEYVRACCPQQAFGEWTSDAWHDLLGDLTLADCKAAVQMVAKRQPFVSPSEIRAAVQQIQSERLKRNPPEAPPAELLDDPRAYAAYLAKETRRIARGGAELRAIDGGGRD